MEINRSLLTAFFDFADGCSVHIWSRARSRYAGSAFDIQSRGVIQRKPTHLLDVLQDLVIRSRPRAVSAVPLQCPEQEGDTHHVAVSVKGLDAAEKLLVVAQADEDLGVVANRLLEDRQRALRNLVLLERTDLRLGELGTRRVEELTARAGGTGDQEQEQEPEGRQQRASESEGGGARVHRGTDREVCQCACMWS